MLRTLIHVATASATVAGRAKGVAGAGAGAGAGAAAGVEVNMHECRVTIETRTAMVHTSSPSTMPESKCDTTHRLRE